MRLLLIFILIAVQLQISAKTLYSHQQAIQILEQQKIASALGEFKALKLTPLGASKINTWLVDQTLDLLIKEKLLYETTLIVRNSKDEELFRSSMEKLVSYRSEAFLPLNDGGHIIEIAAFQVAASAKATLLHWDIAKFYEEAGAQLESDPKLFIDELSQLKSQSTALFGYVDAINNASINQLSALSNIIKLNHPILSTKALIAIASKAEDRELFKILIEQYVHNKQNHSLIIMGLSNFPPVFTDIEKVDLLLLATANEALADAAILAMTPYVDSYNQISTLLYSKLSDPVLGAPAAKALSTSKDLLTIKRLSENLTNPNTFIARYSLLALYLNKSYQAKLALIAFKDSTSNMQLKREVEQWLR